MLFVIKGCSLGGSLDGSSHHQCLMVTADSPRSDSPSPHLPQSFVPPSVPPHFPSFPISSSSFLLPAFSSPSRSLSHLAVPPIFPAPSSPPPPTPQQAPAVLQSPRLLLIKLREIGCPRPNNPRERQAGRLLPLSSPPPRPYSRASFIFFSSTCLSSRSSISPFNSSFLLLSHFLSLRNMVSYLRPRPFVTSSPPPIPTVPPTCFFLCFPPSRSCHFRSLLFWFSEV